MTRVSCQKIWGSIPGSPKWSDDSWRLCICKVPTPAPSPREGRANWGQSTQDFIFLTSHIQQQRLFASKGGEDELKAIHASLYALYFSFSTNNASCFQGREERTEGIPRNPLHYLLLILNKQRLLFPREERMNRGQSTRAFTSFTSHSQQATTSCFQGRKSCFMGIDMVTWKD